MADNGLGGSNGGASTPDSTMSLDQWDRFAALRGSRPMPIGMPAISCPGCKNGVLQDAMPIKLNSGKITAMNVGCPTCGWKGMRSV